MKKLLSLSAITLLGFSSLNVQAQEDAIVTIGTGGQTGVYYVVGQRVCDLVKRNYKEDHINCKAPSTGGSIDNLNQIANNSIQMGVVQSDWQYHAFNGTSKFEGKANPKLRALFSIHPEPFTLVARKDSEVKMLDDLKGKRVNIGNLGSGTRGTFEVLLKAKNWTENDIIPSSLKASEMAQQLSDGNLDVISYNVGHPNGAIEEAAASTDITLVPVTGKEVDKLIADNPFYAKATIAGGLYKGNDKPVDTFGVYATLVTSADVPEDQVYAIVKAVFEDRNFRKFKKFHTAFNYLKPEDMIKNGLSAPLHKGAIKYYKERGWIK